MKLTYTNTRIQRFNTTEQLYTWCKYGVVPALNAVVGSFNHIQICTDLYSVDFHTASADCNCVCIKGVFKVTHLLLVLLPSLLIVHYLHRLINLSIGFTYCIWTCEGVWIFTPCVRATVNNTVWVLWDHESELNEVRRECPCTNILHFFPWHLHYLMRQKHLQSTTNVHNSCVLFSVVWTLLI